MLRTAYVNPLLLLIAQRLRGQLEVVAGDPWHGLGGLHRETMDPDRTFEHWVNAWPEGTQASLEAAWFHSLLRPPEGTITQPVDIAKTWAESWDETQGSRCQDACLLPWSLDQEGRSLAPELLDRILEERAAGHQVWLVVSPWDSARAATEPFVQMGLNLGIAWFLALPSNADQMASFEEGLRAWTRIVLQNPHHDQWVGGWCELVERVLHDLATQGQISRRQSGPSNWPKCVQARWCAWSKIVLETWREIWSDQDQLEDIALGLLQDRSVALADR